MDWTRTVRPFLLGLLAVLTACAAPHDGRVGSRVPGSGALALAFDLYRPGMTLPADHLVPRSKALRLLAESRHAPGSVTWIGHSTFLLRLGERWVLTDPIFSSYASPVPPFGPRRMVRPGIAVEDLPPIDAIVISHNHYDHMDRPSLRRLARRNPDATVLVPLRNRRVPLDVGFRDVRALPWFGAARVGPLTFVATPADHGSRRGLFDEDRALWSGWAIEGSGAALWFAGDTGAGDTGASDADGGERRTQGFARKVGRRLGPFDVALVPIGAYAPRERERGRHVAPEEAVALALAAGARGVVGMHWGTFALTPEPVLEQKSRFLRAAKGRLPAWAPRVGETRLLPSLERPAGARPVHARSPNVS